MYIIFCLIMSIITFALFGLDKYYAKKDMGRISENSLMTFCILGGSMGGLIGMYVFRHKTLHKKFYIGIPVILIIQMILSIILTIIALRSIGDVLEVLLNWFTDLIVIIEDYIKSIGNY